jgi:hypothetical protein
MRRRRPKKGVCVEVSGNDRGDRGGEREKEEWV